MAPGSEAVVDHAVTEDLKSLLERISSLESSVSALKEENLFLRSRLKQEAVATAQEDGKEKKKEEEWRVARSGGCGTSLLLKRATAQPVECRNSFAALAEAEEEEVEEVKEVERTDEPSLSKSKILVVGDSQVRYLDRTFCAKDRSRRTRVCFPGAGVGDVSDRLVRCMAGEGTRPIVCLSVGTNDVGKVRSEELFRRFREALGKIRDRGAVPVVCGILPRRGASVEWLSRAIAMNRRVADHCGSNGWAFLDTWDLFYGENSLYARDGVHLSRRGVRVLAQALERKVGEVQGFFR